MIVLLCLRIDFVRRDFR